MWMTTVMDSLPVLGRIAWMILLVIPLFAQAVLAGKADVPVAPGASTRMPKSSRETEWIRTVTDKMIVSSQLPPLVVVLKVG